LKISFSKLDRNNYIDRKLPGPGSYKSQDLFGNDTPKYSIGKLKPFLNESNSDKAKITFPGPNKYNPNFTSSTNSFPKYG